MNRQEIKTLLDEVEELDTLYVKIGQLKGYFTLCQNSIKLDDTIKLAKKFMGYFEFHKLADAIGSFESLIEDSFEHVQIEREIRTDRIKALKDQSNNYQNLSNEPTRN